MGVAFRAGQVLGKNKGVVAALGMVAAVFAVAVANRSSPAPAAPVTVVAATDNGAAEAAAREKTAEAARLAAVKEMCTSGAAPLLAEARKLLTSGKPDQAGAALAPCRMVVASSEVEALIAKVAVAESAQARKIAAAQGAAEKARRKKEGVHIGMSRQEVLDSSWGRPEKVNRTTTALGTREQWVYSGGYLYFNGDTLTTIQN